MNKPQLKDYVNLKSPHILCEALTTYADVIAHDQRSPICSINLANSFYENMIPKLIDICLDAKANHLKTANYISNQELNELEEWSEVIKESTTKMNNIIENSLKNIKTIVSMYNDDAIEPKLEEGDIVSDNLSPQKLRLVLFKIDPNLFHLDLKHQFKYLGSKISVDQVIANLIQNALYQIKQNKRGEIFISTEDGGIFNILKVKDTAGGAEPEVVKNMFKQHFTTKATGNGVGLDFCQKIMRLFGGDITAESKHGEYMEFTLKFPKI